MILTPGGKNGSDPQLTADKVPPIAASTNFCILKKNIFLFFEIVVFIVIFA
jgi:hypothetical protein